MTYWIYSMGLPVPVASPRLTEKRNVKKLAEVAREAQISDKDHSHFSTPINSPHHVFMPEDKVLKLYGKGINEERQVVNIASEIMSSNVISLSIDTTEKKVWRLFSQFKYRHFPVVNSERKLVGIIADRDILKRIVNSTEDKKIFENTLLEKLMTQPVLSTGKNTNIKEICTVMFNYHIGAVPITNKIGNVIGIITRSDILRAMIKFGPTELWV